MELDGLDPTPSASNAKTVDYDPTQVAAPALDANAIDTLLRRKRKRRMQRVCQPCRLRKVKCTYETPCRSCVERGHAELCIYEPDPSAKRVHTHIATAQDPPADGDECWLPSKEEWREVCDRLATLDRLLRELGENVSNLRADLSAQAKSNISRSSPDAASATLVATDVDAVQGMSASNALTGDTVYLGGNSVPAMVVALAQDSNKDMAVQDLLDKSVLPIFGLDNESATYPFVDVWGMPHGSFRRIELLCKLLPDTDSECMQTFKQYRDTAHVIYPGIVDVAQFECDLLEFLRYRSNNQLAVKTGSSTDQTVYGKDLHWLGLLFAVLASGYQCSDVPRKERQMKSQVYGKREQAFRNSCFNLRLRTSCLCIRVSPYHQLPLQGQFTRSPELTGFG
jgi:hypothetical protein